MERISSLEIGGYTSVNASQVRRDLSGLGRFGRRGVGYPTGLLIAEIRKILRVEGRHNISLVGAGRLGQAIASSTVFADHGFNIAAVFDTDKNTFGRPIADTVVSDYADLKEIVRDKTIIVGVLAVPASSAQTVTNDLVDAGVRIILNYSPALLSVPPDVTLHTTSPAAELLYALYFHLAR